MQRRTLPARTALALPTLRMAGGGLLLCALAASCDKKQPAPRAEPAPEPTRTAEPAAPEPATLVVAQAQFELTDEGLTAGPAKLVLYRSGTEDWESETIEDPASNVFHKAIPWRDGILTIGGTAARLVHWTRSRAGWQPRVLWEQSWGGKYDRLRDLEIGDVDGDGANELVSGTHDRGVVAILDERDGAWHATELGKKRDTFIHELELGDLDGDGALEIYFTPSLRNRPDGTSQAGEVARYRYADGGYERHSIVRWDSSHAKEILVADVDADGTDELYVVREAHVEQRDGKLTIVEPVTVLRFRAADGALARDTVATLQDRQARFLVADDVTGDGAPELIAAAMNSGLWLLTPTPTQIDADSGGFEHAIHTADLDGDGTTELYVASDRERELRRYTWNGTGFDKHVIAPIPEHHITWSLSSAEKKL